ncbi:DUF2179 domain-containing protein [Candidatus Woesearchaeota archaeon]|nr:DUF2179 domain-containing protein [Candidatus Woesearchaeota archaeon]
MVFEGLAGADIYTWVLIPVLIFVARIFDVSIGTMRVIFISRGYRLLAPVLGFFEVLIWLLAIQQILAHLSNVMCYIAYGGGFAFGTFIGMVIEEKLSIGKVIVRVITKRDASSLVKALEGEGYIETISKAHGPTGDVNVLFMVVERPDIPSVVDIIKRHNPHAFFSVEDVRFVSEEHIPKHYRRKYNNIFGFYRKGK